MKHFASIQHEFMKIATSDWWDDFSYEDQINYIKQHKTNLKPTKQKEELEKLPTRQEQWQKEQQQRKEDKQQKEIAKQQLKEKRFLLFDERFNIESLNDASKKVNDVLYKMYKQLDPSSRLIFFKQINDFNSAIHDSNSNLKSKINSELSQQQENIRDSINKLHREKSKERSFEKHKLMSEEINRQVDRINDIDSYKARLPSKHFMSTINLDKLKQYEIDNKSPENLKNLVSVYKDQLISNINELAKHTSFDSRMIPTADSEKLQSILGI